VQGMDSRDVCKSCTYRKMAGKLNKGLHIILVMAHTRINQRQLARGTAIESREHTWVSIRTARRIARDHIRESPFAYIGKKG
jgi:hypothetical protein